MSLIVKKYTLLNRVAVLSFCPRVQQTVISAKQKLSIWKHFLIQYCCFRKPFKVSICTFLSGLTLSQGLAIQTKCWLCVALPENRCIHFFTLFIFPSLTAVSLQLLTQPQQPLFCQQKCSQEPSTERCPSSLYWEEKNIWFNYRVCQASMSWWWLELS